MTHYDILFLCTDNNAKSRSGLEALHMAGHSLLVLAYEIPSLWLDPKRPRELYIHPHWYRKHWLAKQSATTFCHDSGIPYFLVHETDITSVLPVLESMDFDYVVVNGWPARLPVELGKLARKEAMNCHSSFLPDYRGGNITYAPLINGERFSGITVHVLTEQLDAGPIIAQERFEISGNESARSLTFKRSIHVGKVLTTAIRNIEDKKPYTPNPPSVFWKRQSYTSYLAYRCFNAIRKLFGLKRLFREPDAVRFIDRI